MIRNNYSAIERFLHKVVLSNSDLRRTMFNFERSLFAGSDTDGGHIFISGLARSGSTVLLNSIHNTDEFASLTYLDVPFILAPNLWAKIPKVDLAQGAAERAHGDGIVISLESAEAFEEIFWKTFPSSEDSSAEKFRIFVSLVMRRYGRGRYLSKNNQNVRRLPFISKIFPEASIFIPFRDPISQALSLHSQHKKFNIAYRQDAFVGDYMDLIGHYEFGPSYRPFFSQGAFSDPADINHWLEQWFFTYSFLFDRASEMDNSHFVCYERLCSEEDCWLAISKLLSINGPASFSNMSSEHSVSVDNTLLDLCQSLYYSLRELSL